MDLLEYRDSKNNRHPWETARFEVMLKLLSGFLSGKSQNIADIGCGDTFVVDSLAAKFPRNNYIGVDTAFTNEDIEYFSKEFSNKNISLVKSTDEVRLLFKKLDIILLMDVIEHIEKEVDFLQEIVNQEYVNNETLFFISVPAFQFLYTAHDKYLLHYRRYSRTTLINTLKESGLEVIESGYFFTSLLKVRIVQKVLENIFGEKEQKGVAIASFDKKMAFIVKSFLLLDFRITRLFHRLGVNIPGLSTYAICRKYTL